MMDAALADRGNPLDMGGSIKAATGAKNQQQVEWDTTTPYLGLSLGLNSHELGANDPGSLVTPAPDVTSSVAEDSVQP
jgi:hypothetical protein